VLHESELRHPDGAVAGVEPYATAAWNDALRSSSGTVSLPAPLMAVIPRMPTVPTTLVMACADAVTVPTRAHRSTVAVSPDADSVTVPAVDVVAVMLTNVPPHPNANATGPLVRNVPSTGKVVVPALAMVSATDPTSCPPTFVSPMDIVGSVKDVYPSRYVLKHIRCSPTAVGLCSTSVACAFAAVTTNVEAAALLQALLSVSVAVTGTPPIDVPNVSTSVYVTAVPLNMPSVVAESDSATPDSVSCSSATVRCGSGSFAAVTDVWMQNGVAAEGRAPVAHVSRYVLPDVSTVGCTFSTSVLLAPVAATTFMPSGFDLSTYTFPSASPARAVIGTTVKENPIGWYGGSVPTFTCMQTWYCPATSVLLVHALGMLVGAMLVDTDVVGAWNVEVSHEALPSATAMTMLVDVGRFVPCNFHEVGAEPYSTAMSAVLPVSKNDVT
jgi:hypothetical protein